MPQSFVYLWTRQEFERHQKDDKAGKAYLYSASGNMFKKRGLVPGDRVFVVSCFDEKLFLIGRIDVSRILGPTAAADYSGDYEFNWTWASDHIFCEDKDIRPMLFDLVGPDEVIRTMQFDNGPPVFREEGGRAIPDPQTFRGFRKLSWQTAPDFRRLINERLGINLK